MQVEELSCQLIKMKKRKSKDHDVSEHESMTSFESYF